MTRPALSNSAPVPSASVAAQADGVGAGRPHLGGRRDAHGRAVGLASISTQSSSMPVTMAPRWISTPMRVEVRAGHAREPAPHGATSRSAPFDQDDAGLVGVDAPVVVLQRPPGQLLELPRHLDPGRAAADDHEGHEARGAPRRPLGLRQLEGAEDLPAQGQRVVERLHAAGRRRETRHARSTTSRRHPPR